MNIDARNIDKLTKRQNDVVRLYALLGSYKEVAKCMELSPQTIKNHMDSVHKRLDVRSAVEVYVSLGWLMVPDGRYPE